MKTAEEIIDDIQSEHSMGPYEYLEFKDCVRAMKEYAKEVTTQALKDAAENAKIKMVDYGSFGITVCEYEIDKQSILNTEIKLP